MHLDAGFAPIFSFSVFWCKKRGQFKLPNIQFIKFGRRCTERQVTILKTKFAFAVIANLNELVRSIGWFYTHEFVFKLEKKVVIQLKLRKRLDKNFQHWICAMAHKIVAANKTQSTSTARQSLLPIKRFTNTHTHSEIGDSIEAKRWLFRVSLTHGYRNVLPLSIKQKCEYATEPQPSFEMAKRNTRTAEREKRERRWQRVECFHIWHVVCVEP